MSHTPSHCHGVCVSSSAAGVVEESRASQEAAPAPAAVEVVPRGAASGGAGRRQRGSASDRRGGGWSSSPPRLEVVGAGGILKEHNLGMYYIRLGRLQHTSHARQLNAKNVKRLRVSLETNDYMEQHPLSVIFKAVQGAPSAFTPEDAENAGDCTILDGNHRVAALKQIKGDDFLVPCQCYSDIEDLNVKRIVADACNDSTSTFAERTIYDRLYFFSSIYRGAESDLKAKARSGRARDVQIKDLKVYYLKAKQPVPSDQTLRNWLKVVKGTSPEALRALKGLVESEEASVDLSLLTLAYITKDAFIKLSPQEQAFNLEVLARWKNFQKGKTFKPDVHAPGVILQARQAAQWFADLGTIVPRQDWSEELKTEAQNIAYAKPVLWLLHQSFLGNLASEISKLSKDLPQHSGEDNPKLDDWIIETLRSQQPARIKLILEADSRLRPLYSKFIGRLEKARNAVAQRKLQVVAKPLGGRTARKGGKRKPGERAGRAEDEEEEEEEQEQEGGGRRNDKDMNSVVLCMKCLPSAECRYHCVECNMIHQAWCGVAEKACDNGNESQATMRCKSCPIGAWKGDGNGGGSGSGGKKKSKRRKSTDLSQQALASFPEQDQLNADMKAACMADNAKVHERVYYSHGVSVDSLSTHVQTKGMAKLIFLNPGAEKTLLPNNPSVNTRIRDLCCAMVTSGSLHPAGTVVCAIPSPIYDHGHRWADAFKQAGTALEVEDHPMLVEFESRGGGRPGQKSGPRHLTGRVHQYLVAHQPTTGNDVRFTCHTNVTSLNVNGAGSSTGPCVNLMKDVPFENALSAFPQRLLAFSIARFTDPGDTVMSTSGDRDKVIEAALSLGRKVEVFVAEEKNVEGVQNRVREAFDMAWNDGLFKRTPDSADGPRVISPGDLPEEAVPVHSASAMVAGEEGNDPPDSSLIEAACKVSTTVGCELKKPQPDAAPRRETAVATKVEIETETRWTDHDEEPEIEILTDSDGGGGSSGGGSRGARRGGARRRY